MHIEINDSTTLRDIQSVFSDYYPYLQLKFYHRAHKKYEPSAESDLIDPGETVGNVKKTHVSALLEFQPLYTVAEIEKELMLRFGLVAQVLRKEKDKWQQTTGLDELTLKELNELGRSSSDDFIIEAPFLE